MVPNREEVAAKVLDGEAILIHLKSGVYYSMDGSGAVIWSLLEQGWAPSELTQEMRRFYPGAPPDLDEDIRSILEQLSDEGLVLAVVADESARTWTPSWPLEEYTRPILHQYRDMGDLLALDPPDPSLMGFQSPGT